MAVFRVTTVYTVAAALLLALVDVDGRSNEGQFVRRAETTDADELACVPLLQVTEFKPGSSHSEPETKWVCQLDPATPAANGKRGKIVDLEDLANLPEGTVQQFESAESLLTVPGAVVDGNKVKIPKGSKAKIEKKSKKKRGGERKSKGENGRENNGGQNGKKNTRGRASAFAVTSNSQGEQDNLFLHAGGNRTSNIEDNVFGMGARGLETTTVNKKVLVVRVRATGGMTSETTSNAAELGDKVFGTDGDPYNMVTQFAACSYNQLTFSPLIALNDGDPELSAIGVYEVDVVAPSINHAQLREEITDKLNEDWPNTPLPSVSWGQLDDDVPFDHVMYCMPPATNMSVAYAFVNSWLSVYNDQWCNYPSAVMHELGHNLGFGHSGEYNAPQANGREYGDQSGMMGFSYSQDNGPRMCFNAAKSWQVGWYADKATTVAAWRTPSWTGRIAGIVDYEDDDTDTVLVKIDTLSDVDFYVNFNRKASFNRQTQEGGDQVLITSQGKEGVAFAHSTLLAKLSTGVSARINNVGGISGSSVTVEVNQINTGASPAFAEINVRVNPYLINGGNVDVEESGNVWHTYTSLLSGGRTSTWSTSATIDTSASGASVEQLYQTERYQNDASAMALSIPLPNGDYDIQFHLAEIYAKAANRRVFDIAVEGWIVFSDVDIFLDAGGKNIAHVKSLEDFPVTDGFLDIEFIKRVENPKFSGISISKSPVKPSPMPSSEPSSKPSLSAAPSAGPSLDPTLSLAPSELPSSSQSSMPSENPSLSYRPSVRFTNFFINAAGGDYTDPDGNVWLDDTPFVNYESTATFARPGTVITNTQNDDLHRYQRFDRTSTSEEMTYTIPLSDGFYDISLHYAETYVGAFGIGRRIFHVKMEDILVMENVDIYEAAGVGNKAIIMTENNVYVDGGSLEIEFIHQKENPTISAIEIHAAFPSMEPSSPPSSEQPLSLAPSLSFWPSGEPSITPSLSLVPSKAPTSVPSTSFVPSTEPSGEPSLSSSPSEEASNEPTLSTEPSDIPSAGPSWMPSENPSGVATWSSMPSEPPSSQPSISSRPSLSSSPSEEGSNEPSLSVEPSSKPSVGPSSMPSDEPSGMATLSSMPSEPPSSQPSNSSRPSSSSSPSEAGSNEPSLSIEPSDKPSVGPSSIPSDEPSGVATLSSMPSRKPSNDPTTSSGPSLSSSPSKLESHEPSLSVEPSDMPSSRPSSLPSVGPSSNPSLSSPPSGTPSSQPSTPSSPSALGSNEPSLSVDPTLMPSSRPSSMPSGSPSSKASLSSIPSGMLSSEPTTSSGPSMSSSPSELESNEPSLSLDPTVMPSSRPSSMPSGGPTRNLLLSSPPSGMLSSNPTTSSGPSLSSSPSEIESNEPSLSVEPSGMPSPRPSSMPSRPSGDSTLSSLPSEMPSNITSASFAPSDGPSTHPSKAPSSMPSSGPSEVPKEAPSGQPSDQPSPEAANGEWVNITYDDFEEDGWGSFSGGGDDAIRRRGRATNQISQFIPNGNWALRIRANSNTSNIYHRTNHNVTKYSNLRVQFSFCSRRMDAGEGFFVEYSANGGAVWTEVKEYICDDDFVDENCSYGESVDFDSNDFNWTAAPLTELAKIRFRCNAEKKGEQVFIDDVLFQGFQ